MCLGNLGRLRPLFIALALWLATAAALAQDAAQTAPAGGETDVSTEEKVRAALAAYEAGELAKARALFEEAHALAPSARTLRGLGVTAYRAGSYAEAVALLEQSLAHPVKPLGPELAARVQKMVEVASAQIDRLSLSVEPPQASVAVDGAAPARDTRGALLLMPGTHRLEISAPGHEAVSLLVLAEPGATRSMHVPLAAQTPPAPVTTALPPTPPSAAPSKQAPAARPTLSPRSKRARYAGAALLAVGAAAGATLGIAVAIASKRVEGIERHCRAQSDGLCELEEVRQLEQDAQLVRLSRVINLSLPLLIAAGVAGSVSLAFSFRRSSGGGEQKAELTLAWRTTF